MHSIPSQLSGEYATQAAVEGATRLSFTYIINLVVFFRSLVYLLHPVLVTMSIDTLAFNGIDFWFAIVW